MVKLEGESAAIDYMWLQSMCFITCSH